MLQAWSFIMIRTFIAKQMSTQCLFASHYSISVSLGFTVVLSKSRLVVDWCCRLHCPLEPGYSEGHFTGNFLTPCNRYGTADAMDNSRILLAAHSGMSMDVAMDSHGPEAPRITGRTRLPTMPIWRLIHLSRLSTAVSDASSITFSWCSLLPAPILCWSRHQRCTYHLRRLSFVKRCVLSAKTGRSSLHPAVPSANKAFHVMLFEARDASRY